jgi:hypothetical protein
MGSSLELDGRARGDGGVRKADLIARRGGHPSLRLFSLYLSLFISLFVSLSLSLSLFISFSLCLSSTSVFNCLTISGLDYLWS